MFEFNDESVKAFEERISKVQITMEEACKLAGRDCKEVTLIGVSKVFPVTCAMSAYKAGLTDLGENKVQEFVPKQEYMLEQGMTPNWHLIGTLQKNKVKYLIGKVYLIHSVDSVELAQEISKRSLAAGIKTDVLFQVNISREESKHGFYDNEIRENFELLNSLEGINPRGLMTMAPITASSDEARRIFADTYCLYDSLRSESRIPECWNVLSMGMSRDYREAIMEGSTHIRIGTSIFGDRKVLLDA